MPYIKVDGNKVTLGGMVKPNDNWFMYEGVIPNGINLLWDDVKKEIYVDAEAEIAHKKREVEEAISSLIQSKVDEYNLANSLAFKDIYSCGLYRDMTGYTHQAFCIAVWDWQTSVWEYARQALSEIISGARTEPTVEEFIAELPPLVMP